MRKSYLNLQVSSSFDIYVYIFSLISHIGKIFMMILQKRLDAQLEAHMADEQVGFRKDRSTTQQILMLWLLELRRLKGSA